MRIGSVRQLRLKVGRLADELRSKGTTDDPTAKKMGWGIQRADRLHSRLREYDHLSVGQAKQNLARLERTHASKKSQWLLMAGLASGIGLFTPPLGLAMTLCAGAVRVGKSLQSSEKARDIGRTTREVEQWLLADASVQSDAHRTPYS